MNHERSFQLIFCPELVILGTEDEDVAGGVAGGEEVAGRYQDAQAGNPGGRHRHF